jgi:membrane dipeptidase
MYRGRDFGKDNPGVQVDFPKMFRGGVTGSFFALYIPASLTNTEATEYAFRQLSELKRQVAANSDKVAFATDRAEMEANAARGLVSIFIGLENGSALLGRKGVLEELYAEGVRYVTLCHSADNDICDSCTGQGRWGGLSPLGKELVRGMNSLGMVIDVAHTSNDTVRDVLELSEKPVAYTHGCCSALCSHKRNLPDDLIRGIASSGGVVCMSIFPCFLTDSFADYDDDDPDGRDMPEASLILDHIEHAVGIAGVDGVGFGTDYDGINHTAKGFESIEKLPVLLDMLKTKGYGELDIAKMASYNLLRVISAQ